MNLEAYREEFPILKKFVFLDHAAISPIPRPVLKAIQDFYMQRLNSAGLAWNDWLERLDETRALAAKLIKASPEEIAIIKNTSEGVNLIVNSIEWKKGDKVAITDMEFPTNFYPWIRLRKKGVKVNVIKHKPDLTIDLEDVEKIVDEKTVALAMSHVQYGNGFKIDLKELNEVVKGKCLLFIDAIQSLGAIEVDSRFSNSLAAGGHKWLLAPFGTGILYISKKLDLIPAFVGWFSVKDPSSFSLKLEYASSARKFEYGSHNFSGVFGLKAALELLLKAGISNIEKRILQLTSLIIEETEKLGLKTQTPKDTSKRAGIVNIRIKNANEVVKKLFKNRIIVSSRIGGIRVSPHFYNNEEDVCKFIRALKKFI